MRYLPRKSAKTNVGACEKASAVAPAAGRTCPEENYPYKMAGMECAEECVPLDMRQPHLLWSRT